MIIQGEQIELATPAGFEPATFSLEGGVTPIKPNKTRIAEMPILPIYLSRVSPALSQFTPAEC